MFDLVSSPRAMSRLSLDMVRVREKGVLDVVGSALLFACLRQMQRSLPH